MLQFCFDHDGLGVAILHFVGGRHRDLGLREDPCAVSRTAACFRSNASPMMGIDV